ncbi:MAG: inositol monophosphatase [Omnitrophica bacterium]|nr:inositol monophosphatase [Candidatus Omnitrophota bacterium]
MSRRSDKGGVIKRIASLSQFKKVALEAALKAGKYIGTRVGKKKKVCYKGEIDVVTDADKRAESIIVGTIKKSFPRHSFLAEENTYAKKDLDFTWIIDPIDGTTNFLHGFPFFCVSIALVYRGKIILGVVYDPTREELFYAERAKGAFLNKKRIHVSAVSRLKKSLVATGFAYDIKRAVNNNVSNFINFLKASQAVRRAGSAALDLCYIACGRFDGFWEFYLNPWDTAAGLLMVEEAGGKATKIDGSAYSIYDKEILASNSKIHREMTMTLSLGK